MVQLKSASSVVQALTIMVEATSISSADATKLTAFLQNAQASEDGSEALGAPAAAVYKGQSGGIIETMQDLYDKGEAQLEEARSTETKSTQAYQMLAQSLKDEIKYANKDLDKAKSDIETLGAVVADRDKAVNDPGTGLLAEVQDTEASLAENNDNQVKERNQRKQENLAYLKDVSVSAKSQDLLKKAIEVLKDHYKYLSEQQESLVQTKDDPARPQTWLDEDKGYKGQSEKGTGAIELLESVYEDTDKEQMEAQRQLAGHLVIRRL